MKIYDEKNKRMIKDVKEIERMNITKSLITGEIVNSKNEPMEHLIDLSNYPHCYGEMTWINKYREGKEPEESICLGCYGESCMRITREIYKSQREYVIVCNRHRGIDGSLLFWGRHTEDHEKRSFGGYTSDLDSCERYTREEIENSSYNFPFYVSKDNFSKCDDIAVRVKQLKRLGRKMTIIYR